LARVAKLTRQYKIFLRARSPRRRLQAQFIGNGSLDNGTLEEARIVARVQHCGIGERELAKILFGDEALPCYSNALMVGRTRRIEKERIGSDDWVSPGVLDDGPGA